MLQQNRLIHYLTVWRRRPKTEKSLETTKVFSNQVHPIHRIHPCQLIIEGWRDYLRSCFFEACWTPCSSNFSIQRNRASPSEYLFSNGTATWKAMMRLRAARTWTNACFFTPSALHDLSAYWLWCHGNTICEEKSLAGASRKLSLHFVDGSNIECVTFFRLLHGFDFEIIT